MPTHLRLIIDVDLERQSGLFISKDALAEALTEGIEDPGSVSVDDSEYEVTSWEVSHE